MRAFLVTGLLLLACLPSKAEEASHLNSGAQTVPASPSFVPIMIDEKNFSQVKAYLGDLPSKIATPLVNWLDQLEVTARAQWEADHKPKPADAK